jgi:hypothetical protein
MLKYIFLWAQNEMSENGVKVYSTFIREKDPITQHGNEQGFCQQSTRITYAHGQTWTKMATDSDQYTTAKQSTTISAFYPYIDFCGELSMEQQQYTYHPYFRHTTTEAVIYSVEQKCLSVTLN